MRRPPLPWLLALCLPACLDAPLGAPVLRAPSIRSATIEARGHDVLSVSVHVDAERADSFRIAFRVADGAVTDTTPAVAASSGPTAVPVLGLLAERTYRFWVIATGRGGLTESAPLELTTGALPNDLPRFEAAGADASPGFVVFASGVYGIVIDNTGRVVWYHRFPHGPGLNFMALPNGRYAARPPTPDPADLEPWIELDALGDTTRVLTCARGLQPRLHDLIALDDGSVWLLCDESRTMDLTAHGGVPDAVVTGTVVQHVSADGALLFEWSPFDHFAITDLHPSERTGAAVNWTHGNALDLDAEGNLLVSFRSLGEVTKIDTRTGAVVWRMGGRANQFAFVGTSEPPFARQHGVRTTGPRTLLLLDNTGDPLASRAERYRFEEATHTATLAEAYGSMPAVVTQIGGSVQHLPGDRALVSFGTTGRVEEYDADGRVMWRIQGNAGYVFRAQRIRSLYAPGAGDPR